MAILSLSTNTRALSAPINPQRDDFGCFRPPQELRFILGCPESDKASILSRVVHQLTQSNAGVTGGTGGTAESDDDDAAAVGAGVTGSSGVTVQVQGDRDGQQEQQHLREVPAMFDGLQLGMMTLDLNSCA